MTRLAAAAPPISAAPAAARRTQAPTKVLIQRDIITEHQPPLKDLARPVAAALSTGSDPLDVRARAFMEPRFGFNFSTVRIHADPVAAKSAQALNAQAFTVGDHIVFGAGRYAPTSRPGLRLLAHELTHVVQQASGAAGAQGMGGIQISDPADPVERAAEIKADQVMSRPAGRQTANPLAALPTAPGQPRVQRFLAGEAGHGGIEEPALREAGFTEKEAHETYYGNWLRDFSQKLNPDSDKSGVWPEIIKVLATGEFGRTPTNEELGRYLPSEHVDNPRGGESVENPDIDAKTQARRRDQLSTQQRAWFDKSQTPAFKAQIDAKSKLSGLPDYIERAKANAKNMIAKAATLGRSEEGFKALGAGLHAVEDYFAHSNFIEVALAQLVDDGAVEKDNPKVAAMQHYYAVDPTQIGVDNLGRPQIVTGTSAKGPNDDVGMGEVLKTEFRDAEFRRNFLRGATIRWGWQAPVEGGRRAGGWLGEKIGAGLGAIGGFFGGLFSGAARGAAAGWRGASPWWQKPFSGLAGLISGGASGAVEGGSKGLESGRRVGGRVGSTVGAFIGRAASLAVAPAVAATIFSVVSAISVLGAVGSPLIEKGAKGMIAKGTKESVTKRDPAKVPLPTHSQIAKDDPDQPLHAAAAHLAHVADKEIGKMMIKVWKGEATVPEAQELVDIYMSHPRAHEWWRNELTASVGQAPKDP